jgi:tetratricopeptide (TPR) repeat protein
MPPKLTFLRKMAVLLALAITLSGRGETPANNGFLQRALQKFLSAQQDFQAATNPITAAWRLGLASFDVADLATNDAQRADFARRGIAACQQALARDTNCAAAHYYLAMNLGKLAEAEAPSLAAYKLVHEVEHEFTTAAALDMHFDFAGPARNLGELYFQAPGWPLSIGSKHKAREWFERAVMLAPDYPENLLNLAEAQFKWHEHEEFSATMKKLESAWPAARTNWIGENWERAWLDWEPRHTVLKAEARKLSHMTP